MMQLQSYVPGVATDTVVATHTPESTQTSTLAAVTITAALSPAPVAADNYQVCTGIPNGKLHVRTCAGIRCPVVSVVAESTPVRVIDRDEGWLFIEQPKGWVNSKYICPASN